MPRVVAAIGIFHLDDIGAEIGQHLPRPGSGQHARKLDDPDARKRRFLLHVLRHVPPQIPPKLLS
ncbi:hypothetical protein ACK9YZ_13865 [Rhizobium sp. ZK1]|uniref:hypothetical protein n=1 Tax=Rhizobium sp. ZK1 TaxID=3389872 RepID=UPI0039F7334E